MTSPYEDAQGVLWIGHERGDLTRGGGNADGNRTQTCQFYWLAQAAAR